MQILEGPPADVKFSSVIRGYVDSLADGEEYVPDHILEKCRWEIFWPLSEVRRKGLLFYPFKTGASCLLLNDKFGSVAGALCERLGRVDFPCPAEDVPLIRRRYPTRRNLNLIILDNTPADRPAPLPGGTQTDAINTGAPDEDGPIPSYTTLPAAGLPGSYDYAFANLEYDGENFRRYVKASLDSLKPEGTALLSLRRDRLWELSGTLHDRGVPFRVWDPFSNGMLLAECGFLADKDQLDWSSLRDADSRYRRSPLLASRWIRRNAPPFFWEDFSCDQDRDRIRTVKAVELDLLARLLSVCGKHGLTVYPFYGTLLGAVRDGRMIDGDDDIDVALPREDYDRLLALSGEFTGRYFLQTPASDNCFYGGFSKLRDRQTTAITPQDWWADCCEGIGIDIFPLDKACKDARTEAKRLRKIRFCQRMLYASCYGFFKAFRDMPMLKWKAHKYLGKLWGKEKQLAALDKALRAGDSDKKRAVYAHYRDGSLAAPAYYESRDLEESFTAEFEGLRVKIPSGWERLLAARYGWAFGERAGFTEYKRRHGFYDADVPYGIWKERFGGLKNPGSITVPVILFGDGSLFAACLSYYKSRVSIPYLVLLPGERRKRKRGKETSRVMGIPVLTFDEFRQKDMPQGSWRGVICAGDALAADRLLEENGLKGLYIFWHNRDWMLYANQTAVWKDVRAAENAFRSMQDPGGTTEND